MIKLAFTGDIMLSRGIGEALKQKPEDWSVLSEAIKDKLQTFDFVVGNLECPVAVNALKTNDHSFKANHSNLKVVSDFDLLTLANNHIFDCGKLGAAETLKYLKAKGYETCGLTNKKDDISKFTTNIKGKSFGFISAAVNACIKNENHLLPHITQAEDVDFLKEVTNFSKEVDFLFLLIHGGNEMISYPEPSFRNLCHSFIDAGASSVITHHPHVLGGHEVYNNKPVIYSLGDFIFDGQSNKRRRGAILDMSIINNKIDFKLLPTQISNSLQVDFANQTTSESILERWNSVSDKLMSKNYNKTYKKLYLYEMLSYQTDRIQYLLKNEGLGSTLKFMFKKINLVGFYAVRIIKGKVK
ncbi:CapA family protein [Bizionia myxarmorum]|uniref:CapA family protein n=1 Tax=Bizionia myxarmorum TaxID=291186 RepID=A0A5D0RDL5_9FLAO|nr:CapA family protein [Bizionia myxarmorum]TYB79046.1 CapA family protein [Bizionia myxarmorum]